MYLSYQLNSGAAYLKAGILALLEKERWVLRKKVKLLKNNGFFLHLKFVHFNCIFLYLSH